MTTLIFDQLMLIVGFIMDVSTKTSLFRIELIKGYYLGLVEWSSTLNEERLKVAVNFFPFP